MDWKDEIAYNIKEHNNREKIIHTSLLSLLGELAKSPYNLDSKIEKIYNNEKLNWKLIIDNKFVLINEDEINHSCYGETDSNGNIIKKSIGDIKDNLIELILQKVKL